jgi:hypothetical protein
MRQQGARPGASSAAGGVDVNGNVLVFVVVFVHGLQSHFFTNTSTGTTHGALCC